MPDHLVKRANGSEGSQCPSLLYESLGTIVVKRQVTFFGVATKRLPLIQRVSECRADRALGKDLSVVVFVIGSPFEPVEDWQRMFLATTSHRVEVSFALQIDARVGIEQHTFKLRQPRNE